MERASFSRLRFHVSYLRLSYLTTKDVACKPTRRGTPTLGRVLRDLIDSRQGRASSGGTDFGAISSDLGPKILRSRNFFENFSKKLISFWFLSSCVKLNVKHFEIGRLLCGSAVYIS